MSCPRCGADDAPDARFCSQCGSPLPADGGVGMSVLEDRTQTIASFLDEGAASAVESEGEGQLGGDLAPGTALLVVRRGPNAGSRFVLDAEVTTAGRHPDSDILLDDVTVSRRHAEVRRTPGGWQVSDAGSLNGTYLNRQSIDRPTDLVVGDEVQIGKFQLVVAAIGGSPDAGVTT